MLTLLSTKDVGQLQAYLIEIGTALENLTQVLEHAQTVQVEVEAPVQKLPVQRESQSKTSVSRRKRGRGRKALDAVQVAHIKGALQSGRTALSLAQAYGVHPTTINHIKLGKTWKQVAPMETGGVVA
jgi:hypothetical protein